MIRARRGWKPITSGRIYDMYIEVMNRYRAFGKWQDADYPPLYSRVTKGTLGICYSGSKSGRPEHAIVLNELLFQFSDDVVRKVIVHECAHAVYPKDHHGEKWYNLANLLGRTWGYSISRLNEDEEVSNFFNGLNEYKYEVYCPVCGVTWKYKRRCEAVETHSQYLCSKDRTKLLLRTSNTMKNKE